jgi:hypothetical protein
LRPSARSRKPGCSDHHSRIPRQHRRQAHEYRAFGARDTAAAPYLCPRGSLHGRQARVALSGGHAGRAAHTPLPLPAAVGAGVRAVRHRPHGDPHGRLERAARSTSVLLRHLDHDPCQAAGGRGSQLPVCGVAQSGRQDVRCPARQGLRCIDAAAPCGLGRQYEQQPDLLTRLRYALHGCRP